MDTASYFADIHTAIDDGKIVSFRWLSDTLSLPSHEAKQILYEFAEENKEKVKPVFCVIGTLDNNQRTATLTSNNKLEEIKATMRDISSIHVYSIQKDIPVNHDMLSSLECQLKTAGYQNMCKNPQLVIDKSKTSSITFEATVRKLKEKETAAPAAPTRPPPKKKSSPVKKEVKKPVDKPLKSETKKNAKTSNSLLQKLANSPKPLPKSSVLGKRTENSRLVENTSIKKQKTAHSELSTSDSSLTKMKAKRKKGRLQKTGSQKEEAIEDSQMDIWSSDEELQSPVLLLSSDSEVESQDDKTVPIIPKKSSPFYKGENPSRISPVRTETKTKQEKDKKGYFVFSDETVEVPRTESELKAPVAKKMKPAAPKSTKSTKKKKEVVAKPNQKSIFSFFGAPKK